MRRTEPEDIDTLLGRLSTDARATYEAMFLWAGGGLSFVTKEMILFLLVGGFPTPRSLKIKSKRSREFYFRILYATAEAIHGPLTELQNLRGRDVSELEPDRAEVLARFKRVQETFLRCAGREEDFLRKHLRRSAAVWPNASIAGAFTAGKTTAAEVANGEAFGDRFVVFPEASRIAVNGGAPMPDPQKGLPWCKLWQLLYQVLLHPIYLAIELLAEEISREDGRIPVFDRTMRDHEMFVVWAGPFIAEVLGVTDCELRQHYGLVIICQSPIVAGNIAAFKAACAEEPRVEGADEAVAREHQRRIEELWRGHEPCFHIPFYEGEDGKQLRLASVRQELAWYLEGVSS